MPDGLLLVKGRKCGACTACCVTLHIDQPDLQKVADEPCQHMIAGGGCRIYEQRPDLCRSWYCEWMMMESLGSRWRPDKSKILIRRNESGLILQPLESPIRTLTTDDCLQFVGSLISSGVPLFISIPTDAEHTHSSIRLNEPLAAAVEARNKHQLKAELMQAIAAASRAKTDLRPRIISAE